MKTIAALCIFPDKMKSLQLRGCRQIAEPRKYCLVHVIVFFRRVFSLFLILTGWEFQVNSLYDCQNPDLNPMILRFYDLSYPKRFESFKDLCDRLGSVGSYDSNDPKRP